MSKENTWLKLSDSLVLFGEGGINRVEEAVTYNPSGQRTDYITALFKDRTQIMTVRESVDEIKVMLCGKKS